MYVDYPAANGALLAEPVNDAYDNENYASLERRRKWLLGRAVTSVVMVTRTSWLSAGQAQKRHPLSFLNPYIYLFLVNLIHELVI